MPRGSRGSDSRAVTDRNALVTILYFSSRGFTLEGVRSFFPHRTRGWWIDVPLLKHTIQQFSQDVGYDDRPTIYNPITEMWHLDGVDNRIRELLPEADLRTYFNVRPQELTSILGVSFCGYFPLPAYALTG